MKTAVIFIIARMEITAVLYFLRKGVTLHGRLLFCPPVWEERGAKMRNSERYREQIERTFNAFCKIVLYHAALDAYKKLRKKQQFEVFLDYLKSLILSRLL